MPTVVLEKKAVEKARDDYYEGKISASKYLEVIESSSETDKCRRESEKRVKKLIEESRAIFG